MEYREVYRHSLAEADAGGEREKFRESHRLNAGCRRAIEKALRENFDGLRLDRACISQVLGEYGPERVGWVLANTVSRKEWDGRFSRSNKEWAEGIAVPASVSLGADLRDDFVVESHPAVLDGFIDLYRQELQKELEAGRGQDRKGGKPSIRGQLAEKLPGRAVLGKENREAARAPRGEAR